MALVITLCPPMPAYGALEIQPQFQHYQLPVSASFGAHGAVESTGISFSDYQRMKTTKKKAEGWQKIRPTWVLNREQFREVVVRMVEKRACFMTAQPGTQQERLDRAQEKINKSRDLRIAKLDRLCAEYLKAKCAGKRTDLLARKIEGADSTIVHMDRCAALITSILFLSYRACMNSPSVASVLGCVKPPMVRQTIHRARKLAEEIFGTEEQQLKCSQDNRAAMSAQKLRRQRERAAREAITQ